MKAAVLGLMLAGCWWLWTKREAARPLVDYYVVWEAAGYREPEPLPRLKGTVTRAVSETSLYVRDDRGRVWAVGLTGFFGVDPVTREPRLRRFAAETRTNLNALAGHRSSSPSPRPMPTAPYWATSTWAPTSSV